MRLPGIRGSSCNRRWISSLNGSSFDGRGRRPPGTLSQKPSLARRSARPVGLSAGGRNGAPVVLSGRGGVPVELEAVVGGGDQPPLRSAGLKSPALEAVGASGDLRLG